MGADIFIQTVEMYGQYNPAKDDMQDRRRRMLNEIGHTFRVDLDEFENNLADGNYRIKDFKDLPENVMIAIINEFYDVLHGREVTWQIVGSNTLWITGGMSYGDEPTEACHAFEMFNYLPRKVRMAGGFV